MYKIKNFIDLYNDLISEDWNRFTLDDLIIATALTTNNFQDNWISAKGPGTPTSKQILSKMNTNAHKTYGKQLMHTSTLSDQSDVKAGYVKPGDSNVYSGNTQSDTQYILNYWATRAKNYSDSFAQDIYKDLRNHTNPDTHTPILAVNIGKIAYAIWKACNYRLTKQQQNLQDLSNNNINLTTKYPYKSKIENLTITLFGFNRDFRNYFSIYGIDESTGIKFKLTNYNQIGYDIIDKFCKDINPKAPSIPTNELGIKLIVSGKVYMLSPEYKTVVLNNVNIISPTIDELNSLEEQIKLNQQSKINSLAEQVQPEINTLISQIQHVSKNSIDDYEDDDQNLYIQSTNPNYDGIIPVNALLPFAKTPDELKYKAYKQAITNSNSEFKDKLRRSLFFVRHNNY